MKSQRMFKGLRAALLCGATMVAGAAFAQDMPAGPPPQGQGPGRMSPEQRLERMTADLGLSTEQVAKIKAIYEADRPAMQALRNDTTMSQEDKRPKMMAMMKEQNDKIKAVLTDDQKKKFDEMQARGGGRRGGGGPPPAPPQQ